MCSPVHPLPRCHSMRPVLSPGTRHLRVTPYEFVLGAQPILDIVAILPAP